MYTTNRIIASVAVVALAAFGGLVPAPATAQLAPASAITLAKAGSSTATARGMEAISVNPAGLGMPGSGFTLSLVPVQLRSGLTPITLADFAEVDGQLITPAIKEAWLEKVATDGGQSGQVGVDVTGLALAMGNVGLQVSTVASVDMNLSPDMVELVLYGNAGRTGEAADLSFSGAAADVWAITTAGLSLGFPISGGGEDMAFGATLKYSVGHLLGVAREQGGGTTGDPVTVNANLPSVTVDSDDPDGNIGTGVGLDLGFQMKQGGVSFGVTARNVINTFEWDTTELFYRPGTAAFSQGENETDFDQQPYESAPDTLRTLVEGMIFKPSISAGVALDLSPDFTVSGDVHSRFSDEGISADPKFRAAGGFEFRGLKVLHLRGGLAAITGGTEIAGGASLVLGPISLSAAAAKRQGEDLDAVLGQFTLSFGGR